MENKEKQPINVDPSGVQLYKMPAGESEITLPCGLLIEGEIEKSVKISPMTGKDRKDMADPALRNNPAKIITKILKNRLIQIGDFKFPSIPDKLIRSLLAGDRDYLLMKIHQLGNKEREFKANITCEKCGETFEILMDYDEIPVREMDEDAQKMIDHGKKVRYWEFIDEDWGINAKFRYIDGTIQEAVAPKLRQNIVEGEYMIFAKMIIEWNGLTSLTVKQIEDFPRVLVEMIENVMKEHKFGPSFDTQAFVCPMCGANTEGGIDFTSFLFR